MQDTEEGEGAPDGPHYRPPSATARLPAVRTERPSSFGAQRLAYRRATGETTRRTLLAARRDTTRVCVHSLGSMTEVCSKCTARMWTEERKPGSSMRNPVFELCCQDGRISLPTFPEPPQPLLQLLEDDTPVAKHFRNFIRAYNSAFGFTSSGANFDRQLANNRRGVYTYRVQGKVFHLISSGLLPVAGQQPAFAQIYIYDTEYQLDRRKEIYPDLDREIMATLLDMLSTSNVFVAQFMANNETVLRDALTQDFELRVGEPRQDDRRYGRPTSSEVGALLPGTGDDNDGHRCILLRKRGGGLQIVNQLDGCYDPLHFVLLFPHGTEGWSLGLKQRTGITMNQFYRYHMMVRESSRILQLSGRLTQEYVVDAYAKIEESRLMWCRRNQTTLRAGLYQGMLDQVDHDDRAPPGRLVILPPSFTGGPRYMQALYQDAMAIVRKLGKPDLFITMTTNPKWPEITRELLPGQKATDRFDLCCRVFRMKLKILLDQIIDKEIFGKVKGRVYVIEFQKRGLPHAHLLWILHDEYKPRTPEDIDQIVCAEFPDPSDIELFACVRDHMLHGPCGDVKPDAPCMKDGVCTKKYPKAFVSHTQLNADGYPLYRRRDDGRTVTKGRHTFNNLSVVPYNKYLCKMFNCHINVEICSSIQSVKYLYKYVYKGHDRMHARIVSSGAVTSAQVPETPRDETQRYVDGRYISASEAFWRICEFSMQKMYPGVQALSVHDENLQSILYEEDASVREIIERSSRTTLTEWMRYNREHPEDALARTTLYCDFPSFFTWVEKEKLWKPRQRLQAVGRVHFVSPRDTTRYYLRLLLHHVPGATSFRDLRTIDGVVYETYQRAAQALGLLETDEEFDNDLALAAGVASPNQVRHLFVMILLFCEVSEPAALLDKYFYAMAEDFLHVSGQSEITEAVRADVLSAIEAILYHNGSTLANFPSLPQGVDLPSTENEWNASQNNDILRHIIEAERLSGMLNDDQRAAYDAILFAIERDENTDIDPSPRLFFIDGPGGSGKTFLYSTILAQMKASNKRAIVTATSGIAALLLDGGRTLHSTFKVPIPVNASSSCPVSPDSKVGRQIQSASLIVVDEAPMMHKHVYEALDRTFRDVMGHVDSRRSTIPFGGKVVILGGDFRQMLPVVPKGTRGMVVEATLNRSRLWDDVQVFKLRTNVRVGPDQQEWSEYLLQVGEGTIGLNVPIPAAVNRSDTLTKLIEDVYGDFSEDGAAGSAKTILTPRNEEVDLINDMVLESFPGESIEFLSSDIIPPGEVRNISLYPPEFLNTIDDASMPLHKLRLKIGCTVILLRNLNTTQGLCNGTRLRVDEALPTLLKVTIVSQGAFFGKEHMIPRIALYPSQTRLPFRFKRLQFPVRLAFAMTINKSQGQTLDIVGLYLPRPLFAHGQLYVAFSRTRSGPHGIFFCDGNGTDTETILNVVYTEVLQQES